MSATLFLALVLSLQTAPPEKENLFAGDPFFLDAKKGWLVAASCNESRTTCRNTLLQTRDGGATWHPRAEAAVPESAGYPLNGILIDDSRAVLFGTGPAVFTSDGGRNFSVKAAPFPITDLIRGRDTLWGVGTTLSGDRVVSTDLAGNGWRVLNLAPPDGEVLSLVRFGDRIALILYVLSGLESRHLQATSDGGYTWNEVALPCQDPARLLAGDRQRLFLICGPYEDAPLLGPDALFTSRNGGRTWSEPVCVPTPRARGWYALSRGTRIWGGSPAFGFDSKGTELQIRLRDGKEYDNDSFGRIRFSGELHGWIPYRGRIYPKGTSEAAEENQIRFPEGQDGDWLFRTSDGGDTWEQTLITPH